jgi:hypothetical protein
MTSDTQGHYYLLTRIPALLMRARGCWAPIGNRSQSDWDSMSALAVCAANRWAVWTYRLNEAIRLPWLPELLVQL